MSSEPWIHVECDHKGCDSRINFHKWATPHLDVRLKNENWIERKGKHYCPKHKKPPKAEANEG